MARNDPPLWDDTWGLRRDDRGATGEFGFGWFLGDKRVFDWLVLNLVWGLIKLFCWRVDIFDFKVELFFCNYFYTFDWLNSLYGELITGLDYSMDVLWLLGFCNNDTLDCDNNFSCELI